MVLISAPQIGRWGEAPSSYPQTRCTAAPAMVVITSGLTCTDKNHVQKAVPNPKGLAGQRSPNYNFIRIYLMLQPNEISQSTLRRCVKGIFPSTSLTWRMVLSCAGTVACTPVRCRFAVDILSVCDMPSDGGFPASNSMIRCHGYLSADRIIPQIRLLVA